MTTAATHTEPGNTTEATLFMACELSEKTCRMKGMKGSYPDYSDNNEGSLTVTIKRTA
jgi:hypothetical protein